MQAMLTGCNSPKDEVLRAVAWGEAQLLERVLQSRADGLQTGQLALGQTAMPVTMESEGSQSVDLADASRDPYGVSRALQLALLHGDAAMVGVLIEFGARPSLVQPEQIFTRRCNRFRLRGTTADCWQKGQTQPSHPPAVGPCASSFGQPGAHANKVEEAPADGRSADGKGAAAAGGVAGKVVTCCSPPAVGRSPGETRSLSRWKNQWRGGEALASHALRT